MDIKNAPRKLVFVLAVLVFASIMAAALLEFDSSYKSLQPSVSQPVHVSGRASNSSLTYTVNIPIGFNKYPLPDTVFSLEAQHDSFTAADAFRRITATGVSYVHVAGIWWPDVEPDAPPTGTLHWDAIQYNEPAFINASANSIKVVLTVRGTPTWAQRYPPFGCGPITPTQYAAFGDFMYAFVSRYSAPPYNIQYYELGNEPDVDRSLVAYAPNSDWGCWGDQNDYYYGGGVYADMLKVVYPRIKQANPQAQVLVGGLLLDCDPRIPLSSNGPGCQVASRLAPPRFLEGILRNGGGDYFDGISYHAYEWGTAINEVNISTWGSNLINDGPSFLVKARYIRSLLDQYGVSNKFLYNSEGALTCGLPMPGCSLPVHDTAKALYLAQVYPTAIANHIKAFTWYSLMGWPGQYTALLNGDFSPQLIYTALLTSRLRLADAQYVRDIAPADISSTQGVTGYIFTRGGKRIWTLWAYNTNSYQVTLPQGTYSVWDYLGNSVPVSPTRQLKIGLADFPFVYVVWGP